MEKIITKDNTITFFSEQYQEWYHSKSGAVEEAIEKYAKPCEIAEKAKQKRIVLLDICFGLGYNTAAAINIAMQVNPEIEITVYALENDLEILKKIQEIDVIFSSYPILKSIVKEFLESISQNDKKEMKKKEKNKNEKRKEVIIKKQNMIIHFLFGDARETIKEVSEKVDAVFLDPFSPKVCPELWTKEFFEDIRKTMKNDAILATYSCARVVRDNLKASGFQV